MNSNKKRRIQIRLKIKSRRLKKGLKKSLEDNKIYFETITAFILACAAVIVSLLSFNTSNRQLKVSEIEIMPQFGISAHQEKSGRNGGFFDDENIYIKNNGGYLREFSYRVVTKLKIERIRNISYEYIAIQRYLRNYYSANAYMAGDVAEPGKIVGYNNNRDFSILQNDYRDLMESLGYIGFLSIDRYLRISYIDALNKKHIRYFAIYLIYGSKELDDKTGRTIFDEEENSQNILDFNTITIETINSIINS